MFSASSAVSALCVRLRAAMLAASVGGRGAPVPGRRARLLARDVRRARAELPGDSADGASRRSPGWRSCRRRSCPRRWRRCAGWVAHLGAGGPRRGRPISSGSRRRSPGASRRRHGSRSCVYYAALVVCWALWRRRDAGSASHEAGRSRAIRGIARRRRRCRRGLDSRRPADARRRARRRPRCTSRSSTSGRATRPSSRFPRGATLLVDAGGLCRVVVLRHRRPRRRAGSARTPAFRRLDYLALTHGDPDHIGGAASLVARVPAARGLGGHSRAALRAAHGAARWPPQAAGARWANVHAGDRLVVDGVEVVARHPRARRLGAAEGPQRRLDRARAALARRVGAADRRHRQGRSSATIAPAIPPAPLRVVKVPHHGSLTSSAPEFLQALRAARRRRQRRPRQPLRPPRAGGAASATSDVGAEIFRTDRDGAVTVDTRRLLDRRAHVHRPARCQLPSDKCNHEDTKDTKDTKSRNLMLEIASTLPDELEDLVHDTIGCCIAVHRELGPGLLERHLLARRLHRAARRGIPFEREKRVSGPLSRTNCFATSGSILLSATRSFWRSSRSSSSASQFIIAQVVELSACRRTLQSRPAA